MNCDCPECQPTSGRLARLWAWLEEEPQGVFTAVIIILGLLYLVTVYLVMRSYSDVLPG